ncbi:MAG TPA: hypothetical protein VFQ77_19155 [Pseudonocardiaceae bacterium]|jgi:hypothetical protein|nr:hypothetical protein [Pseudonocardiaceae bacterium]
MAYRIRASDRTAFKRCRRAWDLGSRNRQNFELNAERGAVDLDRAVRDALAVYYFPGMWEWNRAIVQPLVHQALEKSVRGQPAAEADDAALQDVLRRGHALLDGYAEWAPTVDHFTPVRVETDFEVNVPDPAAPGADMLTPQGEPIRYADRVDLLAIDEDDAYWVIQHRLVTGHWASDEALQLDERTIVWCWAWPLFYLGMRVAGTVYNEIRVDSSASGTVAPSGAPNPVQVRHRRMYARSTVVPRERVRSEGNDGFRRTRIPRGEAELAVAGASLAAEASAATAANLQIYPSPAPEVCASCAYTAPCLVLNEGGDADTELARSYRHRPPEEIEEGRLGGVTWSMNRGAAPPRWPRSS